MQETSADPIIIILMFIARCLVPLLIMLGISYLLRRLGLIKEPPQEENSNGVETQLGGERGIKHGKA
jgi:hypothetical protein